MFNSCEHIFTTQKIQPFRRIALLSGGAGNTADTLGLILRYCLQCSFSVPDVQFSPRFDIALA